jgi:hypothetical protein
MIGLVVDGMFRIADEHSSDCHIAVHSRQKGTVECNLSHKLGERILAVVKHSAVLAYLGMEQEMQLDAHGSETVADF